MTTETSSTESINIPLFLEKIYCDIFGNKYIKDIFQCAPVPRSVFYFVEIPTTEDKKKFCLIFKKCLKETSS